VKLFLVAIANRSNNSEFDRLTSFYSGRVQPYHALELLFFPNKKSFSDWIDRQRGRTQPILVLLDSRGKQLTSEEFAAWLGTQRDQGQQSIVFAIGPADGWSEETRKRANLLLSFGPMTMPHELARVVLSEQIYRAFTILSGHPYHTGH
jgi:23S rRNA (pseudouridine1915-N3)-methyltransferase